MHGAIDPNVLWLDGIAYPVDQDVTIAHLATFQGRITFGDPTARDDEYLSNWGVRKIPGGIGIEDYDEGTDAERIYWGIIDSRYAHGITLPPFVLATRPSSVSDTAISYPLGVIGTQHYVCFDDRADGGDLVAFGWDELNETWLEPGTPNEMEHPPVNKGAIYAGTFSWVSVNTPRMFIPHGAGKGYSILQETDAGLGELTITHVDGESSDEPSGPVAFCRFTVGAVPQLFALNSDGTLWLTASTGATQQWTQPKSTEGNVKIDVSETPRHLFAYATPAGEPALHAVTGNGRGGSLWIYNSTIPAFERTHFILSPHPYNALGATVWRPGEHIHVTQGLERWQYTNAQVNLPNTGPTRDDGLPPQFRGRLTDVEPETSFLYATLVGSAEHAFVENFVEDGGMWRDDAIYLNGDAAFSALLCDTSLGWHGLWESPEPVNLTWSSVAGLFPGYALWWGGSNGDVYRMALRPGFHNARQGAMLGLDDFAETGYFITGWFDAAMLGFTKIAADLSVFANHASAHERIEVSYQINEPSGLGGPGEAFGWTPLGTVTHPQRTLLSFGTEDDGLFPGVPFGRIRFRFDFVRGANTKTSPVLQAFALHFLKVPQDAQTFTFRIDLARENWQGLPADTMRDTLAALLTSKRFFILQHARRRYRALLTRIDGSDATGQDESGIRTVTAMVLSRLEDAA